MNTCYIVCALDCNLDFIPEKSDLVIGADRGYSTLVKNQIKPDIVIGDFDSYTGEIECESIIKFPVNKSRDQHIESMLHCNVVKVALKH